MQKLGGVHEYILNINLWVAGQHILQIEEQWEVNWVLW